MLDQINGVNRMAEAVSPASLLAQFDGTNLADKLAMSAVLATVAEDGWPHLAYLSAGEVLAVSGDRLRVRLWPGSGSAANLRRGGKAALHAASDGAVCELRCVVVETIETPAFLLADLRISETIGHRAPYAQVRGMIGFALTDEARTLERWHAQVAHMRSLGARLSPPVVGPAS